LDIIFGLLFIASGLTLVALQHALPLWLQASPLVAIGLLVIFPGRAGNGKGDNAK
jgi:steroid 5-alpha reductase family enzyme